jgi:hypothetical protein
VAIALGDGQGVNPRDHRHRPHYGDHTEEVWSTHS